MNHNEGECLVMWNKFTFAVWRKVFRANKAMELLRKDKGPSFGHMVAYYGSDEVCSCSVLVFPDAVKNGDTAFELALRLHVKN